MAKNIAEHVAREVCQYIEDESKRRHNTRLELLRKVLDTLDWVSSSVQSEMLDKLLDELAIPELFNSGCNEFVAFLQAMEDYCDFDEIFYNLYINRIRYENQEKFMTQCSDQYGENFIVDFLLPQYLKGRTDARIRAFIDELNETIASSDKHGCKPLVRFDDIKTRIDKLEREN